MVDSEKKESNGLTGEEQPVEKIEGGDLKSDSSMDNETNNDSRPMESETVEIAEPKDISDNQAITDEKEYTEEEYQRFYELYSRTMKQIDEGQIVTGRILAVTKNDVVVDIGFKSEGTIPIEEFETPSEIQIGENVEVFLDTLEDTDGQLVLSKKKADFMRLWDEVVNIYDEGGTIEGTCVRRIKGGIVVDLKGVDAFLPGSQIDVKPIRDFDALIGQKLTFRIVKVNRLRKNIVVSRRSLLEESMKEERKKILLELEKGQVRNGMVKNITDFGVFVDLGGVDGLLHINDLSWGRINHPSEVVKLDQEIEVVILDFNDAKDRISLGMKQLQPHPWDEIGKKYPPEAVVKGKVVSIADYGAFIELEKGVEGLVHVSEMSWTRNIVHPSKILNVGDQIEVKILTVDRERKRISLGIKQLSPDPWEAIAEKYPAGKKCEGVVRNMTNFGAFVEMEDGVDGLIHISDLSWTRKIKHPSEILKKGEEVEVVVLEVNKAERRLSLGYKQISADPWPTFEEKYKVDMLTQAKVVRFIEKGLIIELPLGLEGFVPLSQMVEPTMAKVAQNIKEGDDLSFMVIEFDRENKRVVLSRKKAIEHEKGQKDQEEKTEAETFMSQKAEAPTLGEMAGDLVKDIQEKPEKKKSEKEKEEAGSIKKATGPKEGQPEKTEDIKEQEKESDQDKQDKKVVEKKKGATKTAKKEKKDKADSDKKQTKDQKGKDDKAGKKTSVKKTKKDDSSKKDAST